MLLPLLPFIFSFLLSSTSAHEDNTDRRLLPSTWFQDSDHDVHRLFRRAPAPDGVDYAPVGTPEWKARFPPAGQAPDTKLLPIEWIAALNIATAAGKIPDIPVTVSLLDGVPNKDGNPTYPAGFDANSPTVCSSYTRQCKIPGDIWDAPEGMFLSSFDDGPEPASVILMDFLKAQNQKTTHFMIGWSILNNPGVFLQALNAGDDIAVHTWSHPHMTTQSNLEVLGQLGWTMQLIHNSTGGRVPKYWRPPYGDSDMRVRAIAKEVFGLDTVIWNNDPRDWAATASQPVIDKLKEFVALPKAPGLNILEHEINNITVGAFMEVVSNGQGGFQNAPTVRKGILVAPPSPADISSASSSLLATPITTSSVPVPPPTASGSSIFTGSPTNAPAPTGGATTRIPSYALLFSLLAAVLF